MPAAKNATRLFHDIQLRYNAFLNREAVMKKLLLILVLALSFSSGLKADVTENEASATDSVNRYIPVWYCYSQYVGPYGWGNYYGYAYNVYQARNNAFLFCANDHLDRQNCVITGCYVR
jgi:hypothetical protein